MYLMAMTSLHGLEMNFYHRLSLEWSSGWQTDFATTTRSPESNSITSPRVCWCTLLHLFLIFLATYAARAIEIDLGSGVCSPPASELARLLNIWGGRGKRGGGGGGSLFFNHFFVWKKREKKRGEKKKDKGERGGVGGGKEWIIWKRRKEMKKTHIQYSKRKFLRSTNNLSD